MQNHSDHHSHRFSLLGPRALAREIGAAQASLADITGVAPRFFRAPAGLRNPFLDPVLQRLDLQLVSWTRRGFDTVRGDPDALLARLADGLGAGDILLLHDGNAARSGDGRAVGLAVLPRLLERIARAGLTPVTLPAAALPSRASIRMSSAQAGVAWRDLIDSASAPYQRSGRFAWHFARGKLRFDPVFGHLLAHGLIAPRTRVLDIGCGQGLLASLLKAAGACARQGRWPSNWAEAPVDVHVSGIELLARDVARARAALGDSADFVCADMRSTAFAAVDAVVILDVLHYVSVSRAGRPPGTRARRPAGRRPPGPARRRRRRAAQLRGQQLGRSPRHVRARPEASVGMPAARSPPGPRAWSSSASRSRASRCIAARHSRTCCSSARWRARRKRRSKRMSPRTLDHAGIAALIPHRGPMCLLAAMRHGTRRPSSASP